MLLPMRGAWSPRPRLRRLETSEHSLPVLRLGVRVTKIGGCTAGTGVEIAEGAETGGGVIWGEIIPPFSSTPSLSGCVMLLPKKEWVR